MNAGISYNNMFIWFILSNHRSRYYTELMCRDIEANAIQRQAEELLKTIPQPFLLVREQRGCSLTASAGGE